MIYPREKLPQLNKFHNVRHIVHDLDKIEAKDPEVIKIAKQQQRIVITKNIKHFYTLCRESQVDMIGVSEIIPRKSWTIQ